MIYQGLIFNYPLEKRGGVKYASKGFCTSHLRGGWEKAIPSALPGPFMGLGVGFREGW